MDEVEAKKLIPLNDEFTLPELKKAFRTQLFLAHPDVSNVSEDCGLLHEAFKVLEKCTGGELHKLKTVDGTLLTELGKGLPITVSAIECDICEGRGWKSFSSFTREVECPDCEGEGTFWLPCKKCAGTGEYQYPNSKRKGKCYLCGGNGRFYPVYKKPLGRERYFVWTTMFDDTSKWIRLPNGTERKVNGCKKCSGSGQVQIEDDKRLSYMKCSKCEGVGEEKIYNPVLPRGFLVSQTRK